MTFVVKTDYFEFVVLTRNKKANLNRLSSIAGYLQQRTVLDHLFGVILIAKPTTVGRLAFFLIEPVIFCVPAPAFQRPLSTRVFRSSATIQFDSIRINRRRQTNITISNRSLNTTEYGYNNKIMYLTTRHICSI